MSDQDNHVEPTKKRWVFKKWYDENKEPFNEKRRTRYATDPVYRAYVLDMNRKNREKRQKDRAKEDRERKKAVKISPSSTWKEFIGEDGKAMLTIGALAKTIGRSTQSIRLWEKDGEIPTTPHRNARGDRLYTPEQVLEIYKLVKEKRGIGTSDGSTDLTSATFKVQFSDGHTDDLAMFKVGALAKTVDRTVLTIEQMERKGVFPQTPFRGEPNVNGDPGPRYYSAGMIEAAKNAFDEVGGIRLRGDARKKQFLDSVLAGWTTLGVIGATLVK